jgi:hypothetical protein
MPDRLQNGWIGGAIFTSSRHLLALPWQKSITRVHRLGLVLHLAVAAAVTTGAVPHHGCDDSDSADGSCGGSCGGTGAKLVAAFAEVAKMSVRCVDDAPYTKQPNKYY